MVISNLEDLSGHPYLLQATRHKQSIIPIIDAETAGHGIDHAQMAANSGLEIALSSEEYTNCIPDDITVVRDALLLHDAGYGKVPDPSGTQMEHPGFSCLIAFNALKQLPFYQEHPERLGQVLWLIYNHDNTKGLGYFREVFL